MDHWFEYTFHRAKLAFSTIEPLLWKSFKLRRFRWFMTLGEFFLPIGIFFLSSIIATFLHIGQSTRINATVGETFSEEKLIENLRSEYLYYTPSNKFTDKLMGNVKNTLNGSSKSVTLVPMSDELALELNIRITNSSIWGKSIGIVFLNLSSSDGDSTPGALQYKIRDTKVWKTNLLYVPIDHSGLNNNVTYAYSGFVGLQLVLDKEFIRLKHEEAFNEKFTFQNFPFPEYAFQLGNPRDIVARLAYGVVTITVWIVSIFLIHDVTEERESGVKELMKVVGVSELSIWVSWFIHTIFVAVIAFSISTLILTFPIKGDGTQSIYYVTFSVLWTLIMLYVIANVMYAFMFCVMFHKRMTAVSVFLLAHAVLAFGVTFIPQLESKFFVQLSCIFPVAALYQGFNLIRYFEVQGIDLDWSRLSMTDHSSTAVSLLFVFVALIFDTIFYFCFTFYISAINPGQFGAAKSPLFICRKIFAPKKVKLRDYPLDYLSTQDDCDHFEKPPRDLNVSIQFKDLFKYYGPVPAVNNVNLNIYGREITALLGHNGAGKTTMMAILTGVTSANGGSIYYKGLDVMENMPKFRKKLGLCPQENRLFPYLTVIDHLKFFGMLKGLSMEEVTKEAEEYLQLMEMKKKSHDYSKNLSGGMKRKLCLSMALMGRAEVLILDEPTSGLDVQSRRNLWNFLLRLRGEDRTIILTTHYMEEADVLGDRIAIMHQGRIISHGTAIFLKNVYGAGYYLTILFKTRSNTSRTSSLIRRVVPDAKQVHESPTQVVYLLPLTETKKFAKLFRVLERHQSGLRIESMGMSCTTMEQVFIKANDEAENRLINDSSHESCKSSNMDMDAIFSSGRLTELELVPYQLYGLLKKKFLYTSRDMSKVFFKMILPSFFALVYLLLMNTMDTLVDSPLNLTIATYPESVIMVQKNHSDGKFNSQFIKYAEQNGASIIMSETSDIAQDLLKYAKNDMLAYKNSLLLGFGSNVSTNLIMFNNWALHSLPVAANTYANVLLRSVGQSDVFITTINHPVLPLVNGIIENFNISRISEKNVCAFVDNYSLFNFHMNWFFVLVFYTIDISGFFANFVNIERIEGFKYIQFMSNVSPAVYWLGMFIFDYLFYLCVIAGRILLFKLLDDASKFLDFKFSLVVLVCLLALFGVAAILYTYVLSFLSNSKDGPQLLFILVNILSTVTTLLFYFATTTIIPSHPRNRSFTSWIPFYYIIKYAILLFPIANFQLMILKFIFIRTNNMRCDFCSSSSMKELCLASFPNQHYLVYSSKENPNGLLLEVVFMFIDITILACLLAAIEAGYFKRLSNFLIEKKQSSDYTVIPGDQDVEQEKQAVERVTSDFTALSNTALLTDGLRKTYDWRKPFIAVREVSFMVKSGESFGLLGVNGAGKTTTFKMLIGETLPTRGDSAIYGVYLSPKWFQYLKMAGYCAQTNCFLEELTGRETLWLISTLRGARGRTRDALVDKWISVIGLEQYQNKQCGRYSGGNKRKLCTAMSLIGDPRVVFLDEPTNGVDPASRRKLYDVMKESKSSGQAVILTSHSMEECEKLCDRMAIMVAGLMKCIGTAQHLKHRFAQGFSAQFKICDIDSKQELEKIKKVIENAFAQKCRLKDENRSLLFYQIKDLSLSWSVLLERMEKLKNNHNGIEDYTITDTSLEEVFLSFTKES